MKVGSVVLSDGNMILVTTMEGGAPKGLPVLPNPEQWEEEGLLLPLPSVQVETFVPHLDDTEAGLCRLTRQATVALSDDLSVVTLRGHTQVIVPAGARVIAQADDEGLAALQLILRRIGGDLIVEVAAIDGGDLIVLDGEGGYRRLARHFDVGGGLDDSPLTHEEWVSKMKHLEKKLQSASDVRELTRLRKEIRELMNKAPQLLTAM
jgi:hypothetical protein